MRGHKILRVTASLEIFFWGPSRPPEVKFQGAKAYPHWCIEWYFAVMDWCVISWDLLQPFCTLSNEMFRGATTSFRGARPPRAPRNSTTTGQSLTLSCVTSFASIILFWADYVTVLSQSFVTDAMTVIGFLRTFGLEQHFKVHFDNSLSLVCIHVGLQGGPN